MLLNLSFAGGIESWLLQVVFEAANDLGMAMLNVLAEGLRAPENVLAHSQSAPDRRSLCRLAS